MQIHIVWLTTVTYYTPKLLCVHGMGETNTRFGHGWWKRFKAGQIKKTEKCVTRTVIGDDD